MFHYWSQAHKGRYYKYHIHLDPLGQEEAAAAAAALTGAEGFGAGEEGKKVCGGGWGGRSPLPHKPPLIMWSPLPQKPPLSVAGTGLAPALALKLGAKPKLSYCLPLVSTQT